MTTIDVTPQQQKLSFFHQLRNSWSVGLNRLIFDHVKKGIQIGSVFGTVFVLPFYMYKDMKSLKTLNIRRILQKQAASLTLGIGVSLAWMMIKYISWGNKSQKLHQQTYYMPSQLQYQFDHVTTIWGGATFFLTFLLTKKIVLAFGAMSPVISFGITQAALNKYFYGNPYGGS